MPAKEGFWSGDLAVSGLTVGECIVEYRVLNRRNRVCGYLLNSLSIHIYIERERERARDTLYIHIYIHTNIHTNKNTYKQTNKYMAFGMKAPEPASLALSPKLGILPAYWVDNYEPRRSPPELKSGRKLASPPSQREGTNSRSPQAHSCPPSVHEQPLQWKLQTATNSLTFTNPETQTPHEP